nr:MAG TPA: hypothetical protein [Caudoviricetes sp.]
MRRRKSWFRIFLVARITLFRSGPLKSFLSLICKLK